MEIFNGILSFISYIIFIIYSYKKDVGYPVVVDLTVLFFLFIEILLKLYVYGTSVFFRSSFFVDGISLLQIIFIFNKSKGGFFTIFNECFIGNSRDLV